MKHFKGKYWTDFYGRYAKKSENIAKNMIKE